MEIHVRNKSFGLVNGTIGTVTRIEGEKNGHASLTFAVGSRSVTFSTAEIAGTKGRARFDHAYAATIYNAQGITADLAIVIRNPSFSANQAYVAASRAQERTDIVIDRKPIDRELRAKARAICTAHMIGPADEDRKAHISSRWARSDFKETVKAMSTQAASANIVQSRRLEMERYRTIRNLSPSIATS